MMNTELEVDYLTSLLEIYVSPHLHKYQVKGGDLSGTLWYLCTDGDLADVFGPLHFTPDFFRERGYKDTAIAEILKLLMKCKIESGVVITFSYAFLGQRYCKSMRMYNDTPGKIPFCG